MSKYIELNRRFLQLTGREREDPYQESYWGSHRSVDGVSWSELLTKRRILILAEAGSGKSREMETRSADILREGKIAFYLPLEVIAHQPFHQFLNANGDLGERWTNWITEGTEPAWIFLDAVDELKLIGGSLRQACVVLAAAIGSALARSHIILSCRPSDWDPDSDLEAIQQTLPARIERKVQQSSNADAEFLKPFAASDEDDAVDNDDDEDVGSSESENYEDFFCVLMQPLGDEQIRLFAAANDVGNVDAFIAELDQNDAWPFARRPLDLAALIAGWEPSHTIAPLLRQHAEGLIRALTDKSSIKGQAALSRDRLVEGASRLALALYLTDNRAIKSVENSATASLDTGALDPRDVLTDWTTDEIKTLMRLPLFDPATYGRVKFHHRTMQEYAAAFRLNALIHDGLSAKHLGRLLYSDLYGEKTLVPSMRPVAAWLSHWQPSVFEQILSREPEVAIAYADTASRGLPDRSRLIGIYCRRYADAEHRGPDLTSIAARRLGRSDIGPAIRASWPSEAANSEVFRFLLKLLEQSGIRTCDDLATRAALNSRLEVYPRVLAIRVLASSGRAETLRTIYELIRTERSKWPARLVYSVASELYPKVISADELVELIRETPEPQSSVDGFEWGLYQLAEQLDPASVAASSLRVALTNLLLEGLDRESKWHDIASSFAHVAPAIALLCARLPAQSWDDDIVWSAVLANRLHGDGVVGRKAFGDIHDATIARSDLRPRLYVAERKIMDQLRPSDSFENAWRITRDGLVGSLQATDWDWLAELAASDDPMHAGSNVWNLLSIWHARGALSSEIAVLRRAARGNTTLLEDIAKNAVPRPPPKKRAWEVREQKAMAAATKKRVAVRQDWVKWRENVQADPAGHFDTANAPATFSNILAWLRSRPRRGSVNVYDNWRLVRTAFGDAVGTLFERHAMGYWRSSQPPTHSTRLPADRGKTYFSTFAALTGLLIESVRHPRFVERLTDAEAELAAKWATLELNDYPAWLESLAARFPVVVAEVLSIELRSELQQPGQVPYPFSLRAISTVSSSLKRLLLPAALDIIRTWPSLSAEHELAASASRQLASLIKLVTMDVGYLQEIVELADRAVSRPTDAMTLEWLRALLAGDLERGTAALSRCLARTPESRRKKIAVAWMSSLFGDRHAEGIAISLTSDASVLSKLIMLAFGQVRPAEDVPSTRIRTLGVRDYAEQARDSILSALISLPGPGAYRAVLALTESPLFESLSGFLRASAREKAARDGEPEALAGSAVRDWERGIGRPPKSRFALFQIMIDRLDDVQHNISTHRFSNRKLLATVELEEFMQVEIARRLSEATHGQYTVEREAHFIEGKMPDVIMASTGSADLAAIELKLAENWSVAQLETALRKQLVGQYLLNEQCQIGCLLLSNGGRKLRWKAPRSKKFLNFAQVLARLQRQAALIQATRKGDIHVVVYGLDLTSAIERLNTARASTAGKRAPKRKSSPGALPTKKARRAPKSVDGRRQKY